MRIWVVIVCLLSVPLAVSAQLVENPAYSLMLKTLLSHNVKEVSSKEANNMDNVVFLDAREKNEYEVSHIKGATWCGYNGFSFKRLKHVPRNSKIIVYCSVGYRSEKIAEKLLKKDFTDVSNMVGGIFEWKNNDYPLVDSDGNETHRVHAYDKTWGVWLSKGEKVYK